MKPTYEINFRKFKGPIIVGDCILLEWMATEDAPPTYEYMQVLESSSEDDSYTIKIETLKYVDWYNICNYERYHHITDVGTYFKPLD